MWRQFAPVSTFLAGLALASTLLGCGDDGPSRGSLTVQWQIPIGCSATNVVLVEARLFPKDESALIEGTPAASTPCLANTPLSFASLPAGRYRVELEGYNEEGVATFAGAIDDVRVRAGQQVQTDLVALQQKQGAIDAVWVFQNGKLCTHNGVTEVLVALFDDAAVQYLSQELLAPFPCDPGTELTTEARTIGANPDSDYVVQGVLLGGLPPKRTFYVHAVGYDAAGKPVMKAERMVKTDLGMVTEATLVFVPCWSEEAPSVQCN